MHDESANESINSQKETAYNYIVRTCHELGIISEMTLTEDELKLVLYQLLQELGVSS